MLEILTFILGPVQTNAYLVADVLTSQAVVIDPAWDGTVIYQAANQRGWRITNIWLTHAHFDHLGGSGALADVCNPPPPVALHPADYPLWRMQGGAPLFGLQIDPGPEPTVDLVHGMRMYLGAYEFEVRHTPGHTPGHVIIYCAAAATAFVGDVIFAGSIGRTDLPGGNHAQLLASIETQVLTLPDDTRLFSGHGPETTVGIERMVNPFLA
jgi:glyoxylase-like metal-dependent hydrolase (beta-lactamase superfamily II)